MVRVEAGKWKQTLDDLRRAALHAPHARTRDASRRCTSSLRGPTTGLAWIPMQENQVNKFARNINMLELAER
jgi:hypothetical protein